MSVSINYYKAKEILVVDYSKCKSQDEMMTVLQQAAEAAQKSAGDILWLIDSTNAFVGGEFMSEAKRLNKEVFDKKVKKGAILGISGVKKILLNAFNLVAKNKLIPFNTREQAMNFLVS